MIGFVLQADSQQSVGCDKLLFSMRICEFTLDIFCPFHFTFKIGNRQTAFARNSGSLFFRNDRVDQLNQSFTILQVNDHYTLQNADLRRRKTNTIAGFIKRIRHIF